jgi:hypothetical protein
MSLRFIDLLYLLLAIFVFCDIPIYSTIFKRDFSNKRGEELPAIGAVSLAIRMYSVFLSEGEQILGKSS